MSLLATSEGLGLLVDASRRAGGGPSVERRLEDVLSFFSDDLAYVERALRDASWRGVEPATPAAAHLVLSGGKRVRPLTVLLSAACVGQVDARARELAVVAELVHSATLLHDDVVDDGHERRGVPTARRVFGNAVSVLAGDLLLTHALDRTFTAAPAVMVDLLATLRRLVDGEVIQLRGRTHLDASEAVYFRILEDKTASLFGWAARAGATVGGASPRERDALGTFGERLGIAFQLVDDVLDYAGDPAATGKAVFADLAEGKLTLPLVLALGRDPRLGEELDRARSGDPEAAFRLGTAVRKTTACDEVRARAARETDRAVAALSALPASPAREMLAAVAVELTGRGR